MPKKPKINEVKKKSLFDHVKHIKSVQNPDYYNNLSDEDKKSFNHFMIIRALSMDEDIVEEMASLYSIFDKIPSAQFYTLLINIVPRSNRFCPWIKTRVKKYNKELLSVVSKKFQISLYQANSYVEILSKKENGIEGLVGICKFFGMEDGEIEKLFDEKTYD